MLNKSQKSNAKEVISNLFGFQKAKIEILDGNMNPVGGLTDVIFSVCSIAYAMEVRGEEIGLSMIEYGPDEEPNAEPVEADAEPVEVNAE